MTTQSKLIVLSGAGLSAPSGVATFRDANGLWNGHNIDTVCNFYTWKQNRAEVHAFYNARRTELASVKPTSGHEMLANWENLYGSRLVNLTQNVDDLLERAGCENVVHLHGYLQTMQCTACGEEWNVGYTNWDCETDRCIKCNSLKGVKPGVVLFHENAPKYLTLQRAFMNLTNSDTIVIIGTSGQVLNVDFLFKLSKDRPYRILSNMEPQGSIDEKYFDKILYSSIADSAAELDAIVRDRMK